MCSILADTAQHRETFSCRRVPQRLVCGIYRRDDLLHGLFQKAFLKGGDRRFAQNRKKILVQCVRIMRISGFFYAVPQGVQPYLGQHFKGQVGSFQIVEARFRFFPNQYLLDLSIGRAINIAPLDFSFRRACLDVPAFPPVILTFVNVFSPVAPFLFPPMAWTPI